MIVVVAFLAGAFFGLLLFGLLVGAKAVDRAPPELLAEVVYWFGGYAENEKQRSVMSRLRREIREYEDPYGVGGTEEEGTASEAPEVDRRAEPSRVDR